MTDYRLILTLLLRGMSYRQIEASAACSHRAIARARKVLDAHRWSTEEQINALTRRDLDALFADGRRVTSEHFLTPDFDAIIRARSRGKKPSLRQLWTRYLDHPAADGIAHYSYDRFCELVADHVVARIRAVARVDQSVAADVVRQWRGTQRVGATEDEARAFEALRAIIRQAVLAERAKQDDAVNQAASAAAEEAEEIRQEATRLAEKLEGKDHHHRGHLAG